MAIPEDPKPLSPERKLRAARYRLQKLDEDLVKAEAEVRRIVTEREDARVRYESLIEWHGARNG